MIRLCLILMLFSLEAAAQSRIPEGFEAPTLAGLKHKDLAALWMGPIRLIEREDTTTLGWMERPEPLGYYGTDFERFRIHITYMQRAPGDSLRYELAGYTRRGEAMASFEGTLQLDSLTFWPAPGETTPYFWGGIGSGWGLWGHYTLREDSRRPGTGVLEGIHRMDIATDSSGAIYYDTMELICDNYYNNQWQGTRRCYETGVTEPCNWGDFRIPDSNELDMGCGEFSPRDEYLPHGWQTYRDAWYNSDKGAIAAETRRWWIGTY